MIKDNDDAWQEKQRRRQRTYYESHREIIAAKRRRYYQEHKEALLAKMKVRDTIRHHDPVYKQKSRKRSSAWYAQNKTRAVASARVYRQEHPDIARLRRARDPIGTERRWRAEQARRLAIQEMRAGRQRPDRCDICGKQARIVFDHCHQHGHFRGWICDRCNTVLGHVEDQTQLLLKMIAYLQRNHVNTTPQLSLPGL